MKITNFLNNFFKKTTTTNKTKLNSIHSFFLSRKTQKHSNQTITISTNTNTNTNINTSTQSTILDISDMIKYEKQINNFKKLEKDLISNKLLLQIEEKERKTQKIHNIYSLFLNGTVETIGINEIILFPELIYGLNEDFQERNKSYKRSNRYNKKEIIRDYHIDLCYDLFIKKIKNLTELEVIQLIEEIIKRDESYKIIEIINEICLFVNYEIVKYENEEGENEENEEVDYENDDDNKSYDMIYNDLFNMIYNEKKSSLINELSLIYSKIHMILSYISSISISSLKPSKITIKINKNSNLLSILKTTIDYYIFTSSVSHQFQSNQLETSKIIETLNSLSSLLLLSSSNNQSSSSILSINQEARLVFSLLERIFPYEFLINDSDLSMISLNSIFISGEISELVNDHKDLSSVLIKSIKSNLYEFYSKRSYDYLMIISKNTVLYYYSLLLFSSRASTSSQISITLKKKEILSYIHSILKEDDNKPNEISSITEIFYFINGMYNIKSSMIKYINSEEEDKIDLKIFQFLNKIQFSKIVKSKHTDKDYYSNKSLSLLLYYCYYLNVSSIDFIEFIISKIKQNLKNEDETFIDTIHDDILSENQFSNFIFCLISSKYVSFLMKNHDFYYLIHDFYKKNSHFLSIDELYIVYRTIVNDGIIIKSPFIDMFDEGDSDDRV